MELRKVTVRVVIIFILYLPSPSFGKLQFSLGKEFERTDNIYKEQAPDNYEILDSNIIGLLWIRNSSQIESSVNISYKLTNFVRQSYPEQELLNISAMLNWMLVPKLLYWEFSDLHYQSKVNFNQARGFSNLQDVNIFSTGPKVLIRTDSTSTLELDAKYFDYSYSETDIQATRSLFKTTWSKNYTSIDRFSISLVEDYNNVEVPGDIRMGSADTYSSDIIFSYNTSNKRVNYILELGVGNISTNKAFEKNMLTNFRLLRRINSTNSLSLNISSDVVDLNEDVYLSGEENSAGIDFSSYEQYRVSTFGLLWSQTGDIVSHEVEIVAKNRDYVQNDKDRLTSIYRYKFSYMFDMDKNLYISIDKSETSSKQEKQNIDEQVFRFGLVQRYTEVFYGNYYIEKIFQDINSGDSGYEENRILATLTYKRNLTKN